ncbi:acetyltransferase [Photobacterium sp. 2_MG-2023]|uniref:acetyltransferase n=1 Tax=Photobacterium sp. 2_MG-2023 TaxID=3062663 RepID=UPI0026E3BC60|nr:acetyltransferase [Photobacterium sp. 2_MG-2023]MDO6579735.1 acetyltransferase [Photobacterium sp. 2_MG-2023]
MSDNSDLPIVLLGCGGHASVLADILLKQGRKIIAIVNPGKESLREIFTGMHQLKSDEDVLQYKPESILLVNGIGMIPKSELKRNVNEYFLSKGYQFSTVISEMALISPFARISKGAQVLPGAIVQTGAIVGEHSIVNSGSLIEHDCRLGAYNHIAPKAVLCGQVCSGSDVYVGAGATVINNINLPTGTIVGAGAVVTKSFAEKSIIYAARPLIKQFK